MIVEWYYFNNWCYNWNFWDFWSWYFCFMFFGFFLLVGFIIFLRIFFLWDKIFLLVEIKCWLILIVFLWWLCCVLFLLWICIIFKFVFIVVFLILIKYFVMYRVCCLCIRDKLRRVFKWLNFFKENFCCFFLLFCIFLFEEILNIL